METQSRQMCFFLEMYLMTGYSRVVHHGGAGTTAAGLRAGLPTIIVPFFGDQGFWGSMVHKIEVGPAPIAYKSLTADRLASAVEFALQPAVIYTARVLGSQMRKENGIDFGTQSILRHLSESMYSCNVDPTRTAVARLRKKYKSIKLSSVVVNILLLEGTIKHNDIKEYKVKKWNTKYDTQGPWRHLVSLAKQGYRQVQ